ncbi:MAG: NAD(P)-binding domain-containing protein, partial [Chloroflexi bacterium]|nr:NAD(P)-binding domain-containing protein [Chloroflexota bacterium]
MSHIAIIGAGGKMGCRIMDNLATSGHELLPVEVGQAGIARLADRGWTPIPSGDALAAADAVVLAVPDDRIGDLASDLVPLARPGAMFVVLDAAAPHAGLMPERADVTYIVTHPCHPALFDDSIPPDASRDFFGGVSAPQAVVCALMQGPESDYERAGALVSVLFAPVKSVHRVTVEQLTLLEPALSETTAATCVAMIHEAMEEVVRKGVPADAARAFILGHLRIVLAITFGETGYGYSDGALKAIARAKPQIFRDDWKTVLDWDRIDESVSDIVGVPVSRRSAPRPSGASTTGGTTSIGGRATEGGSAGVRPKVGRRACDQRWVGGRRTGQRPPARGARAAGRVAPPRGRVETARRRDAVREAGWPNPI